MLARLPGFCEVFRGVSSDTVSSRIGAPPNWVLQHVSKGL